eukprot:TCONS_00013567-protein
MDSWQRNLRATSSSSNLKDERGAKRKSKPKTKAGVKDALLEPNQKDDERSRHKSSSSYEISKVKAISDDKLHKRQSIRKTVSHEVLNRKSDSTKRRVKTLSTERRLLKPETQYPSVPDVRIKKTPSVENFRGTLKNKKKSRSEMKLSSSSKDENMEIEEEDKVHTIMKSLADTQKKTQAKVFKSWLNYNLKLIQSSVLVKDLFHDLRNGVILVKIVGYFSKEKQFIEKGNNRIHHVNNVNTVLKYLRLKKVKLVNIHADAIVDGNKTITLALLWAIINVFQAGIFAAVEGDKGDKAIADMSNKKKISLKQNLLQQCTSILKSYGLQEELKDFGSNSSFGDIFGKLIAFYRPDLVCVEELQNMSQEEKIKDILQIAENILEVPTSLVIKDFTSEKPDERSVMTFTSMLLQTLQNSKNSRSSFSSDEESTDESIADETEIKAKETQINLSNDLIEEKLNLTNSKIDEVLNELNTLDEKGKVSFSTILKHSLCYHITSSTTIKCPVLSSKLKYLKEKVAYGTHLLNDSPLPSTFQNSLNPLLVEVHERLDDIGIILKTTDLENNHIDQLKDLQVQSGIITSLKNSLKQLDEQDDIVKGKIKSLSTTLDDLDLTVTKTSHKILFSHYEHRIELFCERSRKVLQKQSPPFNCGKDLRTKIQKLEKWFFKRNFSERFQRRLKRVTKTGEKFIQENSGDEFCQIISGSIEKFELFYADHLSKASECMKEMKKTLDESNRCSGTFRDWKSTFENLDDLIGIDLIPENIANDISSCKISIDNMQQFLTEHSKEFIPEFCHKFQVDITLLQSRLDFVENYHKEVSSLSETVITTELANNTLSSCHQCLQEADKILSKPIDTSAFSLAERHLLDLQETKLYLGNTASYTKVLLALSSNSNEDQQDFVERLVEINNHVHQKLESINEEIVRLKNMLPRWKDLNMGLTRARDWLDSVSSLTLEFDEFDGSLSELVQKYSALMAKAKEVSKNGELIKTINEKVKKLQQSQNMEIIELEELDDKCQEQNSKLRERLLKFTGHDEDLLKDLCTSMQIYTEVIDCASNLITDSHLEEIPMMHKSLKDELSKLKETNIPINLISVEISKIDTLEKGFCDRLCKRFEGELGVVNNGISKAQDELALVGETFYQKSTSPHQSMVQIHNLQVSTHYKRVSRIIGELQNAFDLLEHFEYPSHNELKKSVEKFERVECEITFYQDQIRPSLAVENETYEGLEAFAEWLETIEDVVTSVERAENNELFEEALTCLQDLETDIPLQDELLEHLQNSYTTLSQKWKVDEICHDIQNSQQRFTTLKQDIQQLATHLPELKQSFQDLPKLLEALAWVQEMFVLVERNIEIDMREDVEKEMERLQLLSNQVEKQKSNIEDVLAEAELKTHEQIVSHVYKESFTKLKELWAKLLACLEERLTEMEGCKEQWLCFSFELEQIMNDLADGEMEFSKSKNKLYFNADSIEEEIKKNKDLIKHLDDESHRIDDMTLLGEDLQEKLSKSGSLNVSVKLTNIDSLKKSLKDDVNLQLEELNNSLTKWKRFSDSRDAFTEWLAGFQRNSENYFQKDIKLSTPDDLKKMTNEVVTKHGLLEDLNKYCSELLENKQEKDAVEIKKQVCKLNEQWDHIYNELKLREKSAQSVLTLWYSYEERVKGMKTYLEEIAKRMSDIEVASNEKELDDKIRFIKDLSKEMKDKRSTLEELIWKGSQMPLKFNFVNRQTICREIKDLDHSWKSNELELHHLEDKYSRLLKDLLAIEDLVKDLDEWTCHCDGLNDEFEKFYLDKMMDGLLDYETKLQTIMSELPEKKDILQQLSITALKFEIESRGVYKMQPTFSKELKSIKNSINFLEKHGAERLASLHDDISNWKIFIHKVDDMLEYLESKDNVLVETQPKDAIEMERRRLFLEDLQRDLECHQQDFQDIMTSSSKRKGSTHTDDELAIKINTITKKWHQLSTYISQQYQVLSLSLHFTEASENIMNYLVNIEEKLKSDIPDELKAKIHEENQKAKAVVNDLQSRIESLQSYEFGNPFEVLPEDQSKNEESVFCENTECQNTISESENQSKSIKLDNETPQLMPGKEPYMLPDSDFEESSLTQQPTFEDNLMRLNMEWNETVQGIERMCLENHQTTNKWYDFTRLKKKVVRWIEKKEGDVKDEEALDATNKNFDSIVKNLDKYKDLKERVSLHKRDIDILLKKASSLSTDLSLSSIQERFSNLEDEVTERDHYYSG